VWRGQCQLPHNALRPHSPVTPTPHSPRQPQPLTIGGVALASNMQCDTGACTRRAASSQEAPLTGCGVWDSLAALGLGVLPSRPHAPPHATDHDHTPPQHAERNTYFWRILFFRGGRGVKTRTGGQDAGAEEGRVGGGGTQRGGQGKGENGGSTHPGKGGTTHARGTTLTSGTGTAPNACHVMQ
jgi:hypothetical protein